MAQTVIAGRQSPSARVKLPADVTNANAAANTLQDVTALGFQCAAGRTYKFRFFIVYTAAALTTGSRWSINCPAANIIYRSENTLTASTRTTNDGLTAANLPAAANASSLLAGNIAVVEGIITPSAAGTVTARFASAAASSAIVAKAGLSYVEYEAI